MEPLTINYTQEDVNELLRANPLAKSQLDTICLARMYKQKDDEIQKLKKEKEDGQKGNMA